MLLGTPLVSSIGAARSAPPPLQPRADEGPISASRREAQRRDEVFDEQGRRRFHGAFTGGYSAGYYNTVGSVEGWAPTAFSSSRGARAPGRAQTTRDFMDAEDEELLGATMVTAAQYDGLGARGVKRGREVAEAEARGDSRGAALIPGPLPEELFLRPSALPIGVSILRALGWREGQPLGAGQGVAARAHVSLTALDSIAKPAAALTAAASEASAVAAAAAAAAATTTSPDPYDVARIFREGTRRALGTRHGVGFDPQALRVREDAGAALQRRVRVGGGQAPQVVDGKRRLALSAGGVEYYEEGGGDVRHLRSAAFDDDEGEDDASAFRQQSLLEYDIPSARHMTGADGDRSKHLLRLTDRGGGGRGSAGQLLLSDEPHDARPPLPHHVCVDGRPPLTGFHLSTHLERSFLEDVRKYPPPIPPRGWTPAPALRALFTNNVTSGGCGGERGPPPLYVAHGFRVGGGGGSGAQAGGVLKHHVPSPPPPPSPHAHAATAAAQSALARMDALFASRFVSAGAMDVATGGGGGVSGAAATTATATAVAASKANTLPALGTRCERASERWVPSLILLKRLGVADPLSKAERGEAERAAVAAVGGSGGGAAPAAPAHQGEQPAWARQLFGAAPTAGGGGSALPRYGASAVAVVERDNDGAPPPPPPRFAASLAPIMATASASPTTALLFAAIFGGSGPG